jgi:hypothetical protein
MLINVIGRAVGRKEGRLEKPLHVYNLFSCSLVGVVEKNTIELIVVVREPESIVYVC